IAADAIGSRPSTSRSWSRSASCSRSRLPSARHRLKYQNTVCHGGNSRGRSRQAQPVRTTYRIALTISRRGCFSRRPAAAGGGNSGSISCHCSSVRSESYRRGDEGEDATSRKIPAIPRQAGEARRPDLKHVLIAGKGDALLAEEKAQALVADVVDHPLGDEEVGQLGQTPGRERQV